MRWRLQLAVLLGLSFSDVASLGQGPPDDERLSSISAESDSYPPDDAGYFDSDGVARFQLIQGRLCLDAPRHRKGAQRQDQDGVFESITVTARRGIPSVHYIHRTEKHEILLSVQHARAVRIESTLTGSGETAVINQPAIRMPGGNAIDWVITKVRTTDGEPEQVAKYAGATLLHLRHADERRFDRHYGPLMRRLLRGRTLHSLSLQTDAALMDRIRTSPPIDVVAVNRAIDQLAAPKIAERRQAQRELLSYGALILPVIHRRQTMDLDAEQIERLSEITASLRPLSDDTPATLSAMLVNDDDHWSRIASRLTPKQIQLANTHLQQIGHDPLPVQNPVTRVASNDAMGPSALK